MNDARFTVTWSRAAADALVKIADKRHQRVIFERASALASDPEAQGKALLGPLAGFRSVRVVGQRYRIIYRVERERIVVVVLAVGLRKGGQRSDIYELAKKLVRLGLVKR